MHDLLIEQCAVILLACMFFLINVWLFFFCTFFCFVEARTIGI